MYFHSYRKDKGVIFLIIQEHIGGAEIYQASKNERKYYRFLDLVFDFAVFPIE